LHCHPDSISELKTFGAALAGKPLPEITSNTFADVLGRIPDSIKKVNTSAFGLPHRHAESKTHFLLPDGILS